MIPASIPYCLPSDITPEQFLAEYWQKKPLLIKNGLPALVGMFEPDDILGLATDENATARLITQHPLSPLSDEWSLKTSPLFKKDFVKLPTYWTLLIQNMEQWSPELANLWHAFDFIPQWQRDDIMVSYAPVGGSVGKHYDNYDVFLAQGYGARHWQLGKICDETTEFLAGQPIRLIDDMGYLVFDHVLEAGDVLYVPSNLSHYGLAVEDCLTFSFGFRRPSLLSLLDNLADIATQDEKLAIPLKITQPLTKAGEVSATSIADIRQQLIALLQSEQGSKLIEQTIMETVSKRQYDLLLPEDILDVNTIREALESGAVIHQDLASRIIYFDEQLYINGELIKASDMPKNIQQCLKHLANGQALTLSDLKLAAVPLEAVAEWAENGWIWLAD